MDCSRCGRPLRAGAKWCSYCGEKAPTTVAFETGPLPGPTIGSSAVEPATVPVPPAVAPLQGGASPAGAGAPISGSAIAALVFAILGVLGPMFLVGEILGLLFAGRALGEIQRAGGALAGGQLARAARIISWTGLVLILLAAAVAGGLAALAYYSSGDTPFDPRN